jgi:hypothetical protein
VKTKRMGGTQRGKGKGKGKGKGQRRYAARAHSSP